MNELDKKIREALAAEDEELVASFDGDQTLFQMVAETFHGRHWWLVVMVFIAITVFLVLAIFAAVQFFQTESVRDMIMWTGIFIFCLLAVMANKIWYWMELNKNSVTKEVKRVELQIAHLARRLRALEETK